MAINDATITLYTNHGCPYAHRAHIVLNELGLKFDEVIIDLEKPREPWYLKINPRGLVPAIRYSNPALGSEPRILVESSIIAQFLSDVHPSHLLPESNTPQGAFFRSRVNFFIDTWSTKVGSYMYSLFRAVSDEARENTGREWIAAIKKEIEPLLVDAAPFFGGSEKPTLVEVNIAPFLLRIYALSEGGVLPISVKNGLESLPNFSKWAKVTMAQPSVTKIWDSERIVTLTANRIQKMKTQQALNGAANGIKSSAK